MSGTVILDTGPLLLLIVGTADREYIKMHKRIDIFNESDFVRLLRIVEEFSEILLIPHIAAETSSFAKSVRNPARRDIQIIFKKFVETVIELPIPSPLGVAQDEFHLLGLTDAVLLSLCVGQYRSIEPTLITSDEALFNQAYSSGCSAIYFMPGGE